MQARFAAKKKDDASPNTTSPLSSREGLTNKASGKPLRSNMKGERKATQDPEEQRAQRTSQVKKALNADQRGKRLCPPRKHPERITKREKTIQKFKNINFSQRDSDPQLTVQNLEFPDANIKRTELHKRDECGKSVIARHTARDLDSSSNSHFRDGIETVKLRQGSCTPTSDTISAGTRRATIERESNRFRGIVNSLEMLDSKHKPSEQPVKFNGAQWKKACSASYVAGAPRARIGRCPENYEQLAKLTAARQKFFLTQDPRKAKCLINPAALRHKPLSKNQEHDMISKMVKHGDNLCASAGSETSGTYICEVLDVQNPLGLDFQGMDYKNCYEKDEVDLQNQLHYWRIKRYIKRRETQKTTKDKVEAELDKERTAVPARFDTNIKDDPIEENSLPRSPRFSVLYRSTEKPDNKNKIEREEQRREERYKEIYLKNKLRRAELEEEKRKQEAAAKEMQARIVAEQDLQNDVAVIDDAIERSFRKHVDIKPVIRKRKVFPKTLTETERLKSVMHRENCIARDKARIAQKFYLERTGKLKKMPDVEQQMRCEESILGSLGSSPSEQSSDDEDYLKVGKIGEKFQLRGFHFKHGDGLRGKFHRHQKMEGKRTVKGCLTRDEWLNQLAPRKEPIKLDVETGITKVLDPDDPNLNLFPPEPLFIHRRERRSAVKEFIGKRLGQHYHRHLRKNLKIVAPKLQYKVKKFNLIRYVFPEQPVVPADDRKLSENYDLMVDAKKVNTTLEYIELKKKMAKANHQKKKRERMQILGIPCVESKQLRAANPCEVQEEEVDLDWVPEPEPFYSEYNYRLDSMPTTTQRLLDDENDHPRRQTGGGNSEPPYRYRGNMPAPPYRERTLMIHPRRRRDYEGERVNSSEFNECLIDSLPMLEQPPPDRVKFANVRTKKRPYTELLEARHHHDHWSPTQVKNVHVHYQTKCVYPETTKVIQKEKVPIVKFEKANPPCAKYVDKDLTMPDYNFDKIIKDHLTQTRQDKKEAAKEVVQDLCHQHDFVFHSRDPEELAQVDFPGRRQYLDFLRETREAIYETKDIEPGEERLLVDRKKIISELEEDLKSIENCLSSLSSSDCTDLSSDSGSFLILEGKTKLPLEYIRKPLVPFEEMRRSRFHAEIIDVDAEEANPYRLLPFSGQHKEQAALLGPKDKFFTFSSRLRNGLRLRLEVPVPDVRNTLLGPGPKKYYGAVITDLDENYIEELRSRATIKSFNFKSGIELLKVAMRLKYESLLIQGQMVRTKIYDRMNERHWVNMKNTKILYEALFAKWQKKEYNSAMTMVYEVKSYYETTDRLKQEYRGLERELMMLNMDIVFIEGHWIRCIMLQNFHYLMGDQEWRMENDWIHLVNKKKRHKNTDATDDVNEEEDLESMTEEDDEEEKLELESYDESIAKRAIVNIRVRDKDDAWAIRAFYYDVYMRNLHPILQVFPDAAAFLHGLENLKTKTFMLLLEMHFTLSIHTELQGRLETFIDWCAMDLKEKQEYVARKSAKKYFMEDRAVEMENRVHHYLDKPIANSFADESFNKNRAILAEVWRRIVPANVRGSGDAIPNSSDMVAAISDVLIEILSKFEQMDINRVREVEMNLRKRRRYLEKLSSQAYQVERRIDLEMKKVRRNLEPPYKPQRRVGRLPRLHPKKRIVKVEKLPPVISEHTRNFMRAFKEDGAIGETMTHDSLMVVDNMQEQIIPFYFDHFLKINGYVPNYNFKTNIELRDGPEINRFQVRDVIPDVLQKVENWEQLHKKIMEESIQRNPRMYENVN
ncbi:uncharacterized protein [Drosophila tropicalis]|uniref:uncharacterized protein n=1 Tax=Drosophila tropicalis TaxID=46794 RepID=UPI0035ABF8F3